MNTVTLMCGIPGSGKTHIIKTYATQPHAVVSADSFFYALGQGQYKFDPEKLGEAHAAALRHFLTFVQRDPAKAIDIYVDNTNLRLEEMSPYVQLAKAFDFKVEIVKVSCSPQVAFERCVHKVSLQVIERMADRFQRLRIPEYWGARVVYSGEPWQSSSVVQS